MGCSHSRIRPTHHGKEPLGCANVVIESPHTKYEQRDIIADSANHKTLSNGHMKQDADNNNSKTEDHKSENGLNKNTLSNNKTENEKNGHIIHVNKRTENNNTSEQNSQKNVKKLQRNGSAFLELSDSSDKILASKAQQQQQQQKQQEKQQTNKSGQKNKSENFLLENVDSTKDSVALKGVLKPSGNSIQQDFVIANRPHKSVTFVESVMVLR